MDDELKKVLLLWVALPFIGMAHAAFAPPAYLELWQSVLSPATFMGVGIATVVAPFIRGHRRDATLKQLEALFAERRYAELLTHAARARRLWPGWLGAAVLQGWSELLLWRVNAARETFLRPLPTGPEPFEEQQAMRLALIAAEIGGEPDRERARVARARLPASVLEVPNFIRAARERDWRTVIAQGRGLHVEPCLAPLIDVLIAMAEEDTNPRPIDKITFLGETGLEQVEKIWPDLADFVRRAPSA